jgi:dTDP-4-dehydrorhamnose reductase
MSLGGVELKTLTSLMRILITGANGQLGKELNSCFSKFNVEIISFDKTQLDITKIDKIRDCVENFLPDWIINCAAWTNVEGAESNLQDAMDLNAYAVENIGRAALEFRSRVIHISTDYVFDGTKSLPYTEVDSTNPINAYGKSKLEGELTLRENLEYNSFLIRTSWIYGPSVNNTTCN